MKTDLEYGDSALKVVAVCEKCGREFITIGAQAFDAYRDQRDRSPIYKKNANGKSIMQITEPCGGRIIPVIEVED